MNTKKIGGLFSKTQEGTCEPRVNETKLAPENAFNWDHFGVLYLDLK